MGKRIEDLGLDPNQGPPSRDDLAISRRAAVAFSDEITRMIDSGEYDWCWGTLNEIRTSVNQRDQVTQGQRDAVHNIKVGHQRHEDQKEGWDRHESRTGRRYEGFEDPQSKFRW